MVTARQTTQVFSKAQRQRLILNGIFLGAPTAVSFMRNGDLQDRTLTVKTIMMATGKPISPFGGTPRGYFMSLIAAEGNNRFAGVLEMIILLQAMTLTDPKDC